jgi:hypothetical protein
MKKYISCDVIALQDTQMYEYFVQQCRVVILVTLGELLCVLCGRQGTQGGSSFIATHRVFAVTASLCRK